MKVLCKILVRSFIFTIRLTEKRDVFFWEIEADGFRYTQFLSFSKVFQKSTQIHALQLIVGPLNFMLGWK